MVYRNWRQPKSKIHRVKNKKHNPKHTDDIQSAKKDEESLKRKKKRLSIDWFFRPGGD